MSIPFFRLLSLISPLSFLICLFSFLSMTDHLHPLDLAIHPLEGIDTQGARVLLLKTM